MIHSRHGILYTSDGHVIDKSSSRRIACHWVEWLWLHWQPSVNNCWSWLSLACAIGLEWCIVAVWHSESVFGYTGHEQQALYPLSGHIRWHWVGLGTLWKFEISSRLICIFLLILWIFFLLSVPYLNIDCVICSIISISTVKELLIIPTFSMQIIAVQSVVP